MNKIKYILICFFLHLFSQLLFAQNGVAHHYFTIENNLPSNEVYFVQEDRIGNLWMGTDYGIAVYDGIHIKSYTTADGLPDNTVFREYIDHKNRMWFMSYTGGVFYIENEQIKIPKFNAALVDSIGQYSIREMYVDENDFAYFINSNKNTGYYKAKVSGNELTHVYRKFDFDLLKIKKEVYTVNELGITNEDNRLLQAFSFVKSHHQCSVVYNENKVAYVSLLNEIYKFDDKQFVKVASLSSTILKLYKKGNQLLVGLFDGSLVQYTDYGGNMLVEKNTYSFSTSISGITCDREGFFWLSTTGKGIVRMTSLNYQEYELPASIPLQKICRLFYIQGDTIHIIKKARLEKNKFKIEKLLKVGSELSEIYLDGRKYFYSKGALIRLIRKKDQYFIEGEFEVDGDFFSSSVGWYDLNTFSSIDMANYVSKEDKVFTVHNTSLMGVRSKMRTKAFIHTKDGHTIRIDNDRFVEYDMGSLYLDSKHYKLPKGIHTVYKIAENDYWIGTHAGLYRFKHGYIEDFTAESIGLSKKIHVIEQMSDGHFLFGTDNNGIVILKNDCELINISSVQGLTSNHIRDIKVAGDTVWVASSNGVNRLLFDDANLQSIQYVCFNTISTNHQVDNIYLNGDELLFYRNNKLYSVDAALDNYAVPPKIYVTDVVHNGISYKKKNQILKMAYGDSVSFSFRMNTLKGGPFAYYNYRLKGIKDSWRKTKQNKLQFYDLAYGEYEFEIQGVNNIGLPTSNTSTVPFTVPKPLFNSFFFYVFLILGITAISFGFIYWYYHQKQRQLLQEKALLHSNIFALKMQINPHFIFNALNSIQYYIALHEKRTANIFLAKFSNLIRDILSSADHIRISLDKEITQMSNYIEMEHMRTDQSFDWKIEYGEGVNKQMNSLPSMILQPIVENAIWHGLSKIDYRGELLLSFEILENYLCCKIIDNGIGIDIENISKENDNTSKIHQSIGLENVMKRLDLIGEMENNKYPITFENANPTQEKYKGTIVSILIPQQEL